MAVEPYREYTPLEKLGFEAAARLYFNCPRQVARTIVAFLVKPPERSLGVSELGKYMNWPDREASRDTVRTVMSTTRRLMKRVSCSSEIVNISQDGCTAQYIMTNKPELIRALRQTARMK